MVWSLQEPLSISNGSVVIMEDVANFRQLVAEYHLRLKTLQGWLEYSEQGSTIGQKRIHPFPEIFSGKIISAVSLNITKLVADGTSIMFRKVYKKNMQTGFVVYRRTFSVI